VGGVFAVVSQTAPPVGVTGYVQQREGWVCEWDEGLIARITTYPEADIDEARAAAERVAEERGSVMSQKNVDIVRRCLLRSSEQDLDAALRDVAPGAELDWSASEGPDAGVYRGPEEWRKWLTARWEALRDVRFDLAEVIDVPPDTVVVVARMRGRGRASGIEIAALGASVWTVRAGQVTGATMYQTRGHALEAVGLTD
jgi:ketosteroid isomerase-like protein